MTAVVVLVLDGGFIVDNEPNPRVSLAATYIRSKTAGNESMAGRTSRYIEMGAVGGLGIEPPGGGNLLSAPL